MLAYSKQIRSCLQNIIRLQHHKTHHLIQIRQSSSKSPTSGTKITNEEGISQPKLTTKLEKPKKKAKHQPKTLINEMQQLRTQNLTSKSNLPPWIKRELTQKQKYERWNPKRKLTRQEMIKLKELKETFSNYRSIDLAQFFHISPEAVRRILKSKWVPNEIDEDRIMRRKEKQMMIRQENKMKEKLNRDGFKYRSSSNRFLKKRIENDDEEFNSNYDRIQSKF
ncbi:RRG9 [Candida pseudojiufengensis]|uniref:RRG9 n=1 Tax=Candida pseudojiufengensis TaxID=497109 RepID=UPI002225A7C8|nr:RRG9 [Candida pseudojiufengensis]KAI5965134.1 RRG9 [Candida pseudojiufengensis]